MRNLRVTSSRPEVPVMKYQRIENRKTILEAVPPTDEKMNALKGLLETLGLPVTVH